MNYRSSFARAALLSLALLTSACGGQGLGETLGFDRTAPDEFTVVSRPSLAVPPEFTLHPPKPGEPPRGASAEETARTLLTGKDAPADAKDLQLPKVETAVTPVISKEAPSGATMGFLKKLGADTADEGIRAKLLEDEARPADTSKANTLYEQLMEKEKPEPVVDAKKESERLRANKDAGKPANEGDVPVEQVKPKTVLDRIF